jgi:hypothetical protein
MSTDLEIFLIDLANAKTKFAADCAHNDFMAALPSGSEEELADSEYLKWLYIHRHGRDVVVRS